MNLGRLIERGFSGIYFGTISTTTIGLFSKLSISFSTLEGRVRQILPELLC